MTDLENIRKYYGEAMAHFCRDYFATILENDGKLFEILSSNFAYDKYLYEDLEKHDILSDFKNYIYHKFNPRRNALPNTGKTPFELFDDAGYILYECETEDDIQKFKKYYKEDEEICTFNGKRLEKCHVFFAVKKNVGSIKREDFKNPRREDEYGTSVISIQFSRGDINTLSIKNRYNHTVNNPDATFGNNLENIISGLTESFSDYYGLNINSNLNDIPITDYKYVLAYDGKYYRYNYEINGIYYCPNNIIIDNGIIVDRYAKEKERYIIFDYFILDLKEKKVTLYDDSINDSLLTILNNINKITIIKGNDNKIINFDGKTEIIINKFNKISLFKNDQITQIGDNFLSYNTDISDISLANVKYIGNNFLMQNDLLKSINFPNLQIIEENFIAENIYIKNVNLPNVTYISDNFLKSCLDIKKISLPKVKTIKNRFLYFNEDLEELYVPNLKEIGHYFLQNNAALEKLIMPKVKKTGRNLLSKNEILTDIYMPQVEDIGEFSFFHNIFAQNVDFSSLKKARLNVFFHHKTIKIDEIVKNNIKSKAK